MSTQGVRNLIHLSLYGLSFLCCVDEQQHPMDYFENTEGGLYSLDSRIHSSDQELDGEMIALFDQDPHDLSVISDQETDNHEMDLDPRQAELFSCESIGILDAPLPIERLSEGEVSSIELPRCTQPRLRIALPHDSSWELSISLNVLDEASASDDRVDDLTQSLSSTHTRVYNARQWAALFDTTSPVPLPTSEASFSPHSTGEAWVAEMTILSTQSGRHTLTFANENNEISSHGLPFKVRLDLSLNCLSGCHLESTHYPIVLVHGYAGVDRYFGVIDYFYRVPQALYNGGYQVLVPSLSPIALTESRAEQLFSFLESERAEGGYEKFNLIAHSQGGLDSRFLISRLGGSNKIASLTTIATPHQGIPLSLLDFFSEQDFSEESLRLFNTETPAHPDVRYFSWSARTCTLLEFNCLNEHNGELVTPFLLSTYTLLSAWGPNDGLVPTSSMLYGEHLGILSADHFDQIGQIADGPSRSFDHLSFYLSEVSRLRSLGF